MTHRFTVRTLCLVLAIFSLACPAVAQAPLALEGHTDAVTSAGYSPDGNLIATGSYDKTLGLYNAADGTLLRTLPGHTGQVFSVAISPNGRQLLSASRDGTARIWDLYVPTPLATIEGHTEAISAVEISADGTHLLTGSADMTLKLWQQSDGKLLFDMAGHTAPITRAAIKPDNLQLASGDTAGNLLLWNPVDGKSLATLGAHASEITGIAYHPTDEVLLTSAANGVVKFWALPPVAPRTLGTPPATVTPLTAVEISTDGSLIASAAGTQVTLYNGETGAAGPELTEQSGAVTGLALTADATLLASASETGLIKLWNTADGADRLSLRGHTGAIGDLDFNADGTQLATAGADGTIRHWRIPQAPLLLTGHTMPTAAVAASADGKLIATASADTTVRLYNAVDGTAVATLEGHTAPVTQLAFAADSTQLASADQTGTIQLWEIASKASVGQLQGPAVAVTGLRFLPDGKTLLSTSESGAMSWWQLPPPAAVPLAGHTAEVQQLAVTPNGKSIITGSADGSLQVFTAADGKPASKLVGHVGPVTSLTATDPQAATGNQQGVLQFWNLADGEVAGQLAGHEGSVTTLVANADGSQFASAGDDGIIRLWQPPVAASSVAGSTLAVERVVFSADRKLVAAAGMAAGKPAVVVSSTADGKAQGTLLGHAGAITAVAFSADNKRIVTGSADKTSRVWDLTDPKFPEIANFAGHTTAVTAVAFSTDAASAYSADTSGTIKLWDIATAEETAALEGHTAAVSRMMLSGPTLVSASADQTVRTWTAATGKPAKSFSHGAAVTALAVSDDGKQIATGGADKLIKLFPTAGGEATATLAGCTTAVESLGFNSTGTRVAASCTDGTRVWDTAGVPLQRFPVAENAPLAVTFTADDTALLSVNAAHAFGTQPLSIVSTLSGHEGTVSSLAYSTDGQQLFSAGADSTVRRWNIADGKPLGTYAGPTDGVTDLDLSTDGKRLVAGSADMNMYSWPIAAPAAAPVPAEATHALSAPVQAVSAGSDGSRVAAGGDDMLVTVIDSASGQVLQRLSGHTMPVTDLALVGTNDTVVSASADKTAIMRPLTATRVIAAAEGAVGDLALAVDGTSAAIATADSKVKLIDTADAVVQFEVATAAVPTSVAINADKSQVAASLADNSLVLWPITAQGFGEAMTIALPSAASNLTYHAESGKLAVAVAEGVSVYESATGMLLEQVPLVEPASDVALLPDGMSLAATSGNGGVIQPLALLRAIAAHEGAVTGVALTADGTSAISGGADKAIRQWNLTDGSLLGSMAGPAEAIVSLDLSTEGKLLAASVADNSLIVWDMTAAAVADSPRAALKTIVQPAAASDIALSAEGSRIVAAEPDGTVRVWHVASGHELQRFAGHEGAVNAVGFAVDGKTIASAGTDGTTRLWSVSATKLVVADQTRVSDLAMLSTGTQFVTTGNEMLAKVWNADGTVAKQLPGAKTALGRLALRADDTQLAAADTAGNVHLWNLAEGAAVHTLEAVAPVNELAFNAEGTRLALAAADNHLRVYATADATLLQDQTAAAPLTAASFTPAGQEIVTGSTDKNAYTWAYASPEAVGELTGHTGAVYAAAYAPDGLHAATCGADGTIRLWDMTTGAAVKQLTGHAGAVYNVRFVGGGKQLLSAGLDGTAQLWDIDSGKAVRSFAATVAEGDAPAPLFDATANEQGTLIATSGSDRVIRLFNAANGQAGPVIEGHADAVYRLEFQASRLFSLGQAGNLHAWTTAGAAAGEPLKLPAVSFSAAIAPDGTKAVISSADAKAYVIELPK